MAGPGRAGAAAPGRRQRLIAELRPRRAVWPEEHGQQAALIEEAAALLRSEQVVAFPTDTVYGLGADPASAQAVDLLYALKGRPRQKAIALLISDPSEVDRLAVGAPEPARRLAERYWPGALTIVLVSALEPSTTVALRVPNHPIPLRLMRAVGSPLATTSANRSADASPRTADEVLAQLGSGYPLIIDGGACPLGIDSTVVDLSRQPGRLLRPGAIARTEIEAITGRLEA